MRNIYDIGGSVLTAGSNVGAFGSAVQGAGESYVGILDAIESDVIFALGTRRLLTSYTGNLIRVRENVSNTEQDFSYITNGKLDANAITSWLGGASPFTTKLYDQKGSRHFAQTTATRQPALRLSDADWNNVSSIGFDGVNDSISDISGLGTSAVTMLIGFKYESGAFGRIIAGPGGNNAITQLNGKWLFADSSNTVDNTTDSTTVRSSFEFAYNGVNSMRAINGVELALPTMGSFSGGQLFTLGDYTNGGNQALNGSLTYCIILNRALSLSERVTIRTALNTAFFS